ncbi:MAG: DUF4124 domain-containing protein [Pseudomonadota bacterium]
MKQNLFVLIILEFTLPGIVSAADTVYQWTDNLGQTHYGDKLPVRVESKTIILQRDTSEAGSHSGLRPGERDRLRQMERHQQQQQRSAHTARTRTDRQRAASRARCADHREMLKNSRGRDTFKKHSRYLRNNCW